MPDIKGLDRVEVRDLVYKHGLDKYRTVAKGDMPGYMSSWLSQGVQFSCCDLSLRQDRNDVFRRAALIGYAFARGSGKAYFQIQAMLSLVGVFLAFEGATLVPEQNKDDVDQSIAQKLEHSLEQQENWHRFCDDLFEFLCRELAHHWVAANGNQMCLSESKLCHTRLHA